MNNPTSQAQAPVTIPKAVLDLYSAELHESHKLLDAAGISQSGFDEQLTISQRVRQCVQELLAYRAMGIVVKQAAA